MPSLELITYVWMTASVLWGAMVLWWVRKGLTLSAPGEPPTKRQKVFSDNLQILWVLVVISGVGVTSVTFSDDVIRYAWDGWVTIHGGDPYAYLPNAPELEHLRVTDGGLTLPDQVPYADLKTVYPPGAQMVFAAMAWMVGTDVQAWPLAWLLFFGLFALPAVMWRSNDLHTLVWFGLLFLSPTFLLFGLGEVHLDILVGLSILGGFLAARRNHYVAAGVILGLGITIKFLPVVALVYLALQPDSNSSQRRQQFTQLLIPALLLVALAYLPWLGSDLLGNLPNFAAVWRANAGLFEIVRLVLPSDPARWLMLGMGLATAAFIWMRWRKQPAVATALTLLAFLLFSPVVHAWYLLPAALLLPLAPLRSTLAWLATMSVYGLWVVAYQTTGVWTETPALLAVEYVPVWIAFVLDLKNGPLDQRFKLKMV